MAGERPRKAVIGRTTRTAAVALAVVLGILTAAMAVTYATARPHALPGAQRRCAEHGKRCRRSRGRHRRPHPRPVTVSTTATVILTTANMSQALARQPALAFSPRRPGGVPVINVDDATSYQRFSGVGAGMTDSSAWLIHDGLSSTSASAVLAALFGSDGIRLHFLRVPIGASDFTATETPYSYDDLPAGGSDPKLAHFSIAHDDAYILPTLRQVMSLDPDEFVLASPWSPPAWMKTNDSLANRKGTGRFRDGARAALAGYIVRFLRAYRGQGVRVKAVTPQNEPDNWTAYPGMELSPAEEARFVRVNLAPALRRAGLPTEIYGGDVGWRSISYAKSIARSGAVRDLAGIATHCYFGAPTSIAALHAEDPALDEIMSECSTGITPYSTTEVEISSLRNWASVVAMWNVALNQLGGPVQPPNVGCGGCTGIFTINPFTHSATATIDYYELGQVSKFVAPGAVRIASNHFVSYRYPPRQVVTSGLDDVAFRNPNGSDVLVAYDNSPRPTAFAIRSHGRYLSYRLAPGSTATFIWQVH
ncbi:MAG TPA: glycoside hydrolase family 30 beta sandwich domain-containing protein [Solirubrobacteraceae bacterium]|nr:glycoside hydrolase family 30 beta sandwich domain-containing protein [Solirubrobacteraceae bacterium]